MNKVARKVALAALCTTALTGFSQTSQAAVALFDITGTPVTAFTYGTDVPDSNVVNASGVAPTTLSGVYDPFAIPLGGNTASSGGALGAWLGSGPSVNSVVSVIGLTPGSGYTVNYTWIGTEAGNANQFSAPGGAITTTGVNLNDNNQPSTNGPVVSMGTSLYNNGVSTTATPSFTVTDTSTPGTFPNNTVTNGGTNPDPNNGNAANLIFAYLTNVAPEGAPGGYQWYLTTTETNTIIFGFNDNGGSDDNHDDFVGIASVFIGNNEGTTPLPGALPLFGSVLGGGLLFRRFRKRSKSQTAAA